MRQTNRLDALVEAERLRIQNVSLREQLQTARIENAALKDRIRELGALLDPFNNVSEGKETKVVIPAAVVKSPNGITYELVKGGRRS